MRKHGRAIGKKGEFSLLEEEVKKSCLFLPPKDEPGDSIVAHKHCGAGREENSVISDAELYQPNFISCFCTKYVFRLEVRKTPYW